MDRRSVIRCLLALSLVLIVFSAGAMSPADDASTSSAAEAPVAISWSEIAREIALHIIPENYRDDRHWGETGTAASGVKIRTKGGQVRFELREKKFNHGLWRRFRFSLLNPDRSLQLDIRNVRQTPEGQTRFDLFVSVRARCETQFAHWTWGVKGLNGTVESDVTIQALLDCSFQIQSEFRPDSVLPVFALHPQFHDLDLKLTDVDTRRVGLLGGWIAEELGNGTRKAFEDLLQSQEKPLLARLRQSVVKKQDRLRLDPADAARFLAR